MAWTNTRKNSLYLFDWRFSITHFKVKVPGRFRDEGIVRSLINNLDFASNRSESALRPSNLYQRNDTFTRRPFFGIQVNHVFRQSECRINYIEHVVVTTRIVHPRRGDLEMSVVSPQGTKSSLLDTRWRDKVCFALYCY